MQTTTHQHTNHSECHLNEKNRKSGVSVPSNKKGGVSVDDRASENSDVILLL